MSSSYLVRHNQVGNVAEKRNNIKMNKQLSIHSRINYIYIIQLLNEVKILINVK